MPKTASNLSEAFLNVREYLWDGTPGSIKLTEAIGICAATDIAKMRKMVTKKQAAFIKDTVTDRIRIASGGRCATVHNYLRVKHGVVYGHTTCKAIQDYRHAWLIELSKEFADETTDP